MLPRMILLFSSLLFIVPLAAFAAEAELTLDEAIDRSLATSHRLRAAEASALAAAAGVDEAEAHRLPRLELREEVQRTTNPVYVFGNLLRQESFGAENFALGRLNDPDAIDNFSTQLALSQPVWTGGRLAGGIQAAAAAREAAASHRDRTRQEVIFATISAYAEAVVARYQLEEVTAAREVVRANLALARDRFATGLVVEADVLQLEVRESEMAETMIRAESAVALSSTALNLAIGVATDRSWRLAEFEPPDPAAKTPTLEELVTAARQQRPDLRAAAAQADAAEGMTRIARAGRLPQVALAGGWEANADDGLGADGSNWSLQLGLRWTAFDGFATRARVHKARREAEAASEIHASLERRVALEVQESLLELAAAAERRVQAERAAVLAARNLTILQDRYREGLATLVELQEGESASTRARARGVSALRDALIAQARLELALGTL